MGVADGHDMIRKKTAAKITHAVVVSLVWGLCLVATEQSASARNGATQEIRTGADSVEDDGAKADRKGRADCGAEGSTPGGEGEIVIQGTLGSGAKIWERSETGAAEKRESQKKPGP